MRWASWAWYCDCVASMVPGSGVMGPLALKLVVFPLRWQGAIVGGQQLHGLLWPVHVVAPRVRKALPSPAEILGVVRGAGQVGPFTCCWLFWRSAGR